MALKMVPSLLPPPTYLMSKDQSQSTGQQSRSSDSKKQFYSYRIVLQKMEPNHFACHRITNGDITTSFPTLEEATAHLVFLRALGKLKDQVIGVPIPPFYNKSSASVLIPDEKKWQVFVTNAVRRFIIFLETCRNKFGRYEDEVTFYAGDWFQSHKRIEDTLQMSKLLPPLDILMVWHSFMLNPSSFYETCTRNNLLPFAYIPFPLLEVARAIDPTTFDYSPSDLTRDKFADFAPNIQYDVNVSQIFSTILPVHCPICYKVICEVPYTDQYSTGFADQGFAAKSSDHDCLNISNQHIEVNHRQLRNLQMVADLKLSTPMPGIIRNFSPITHHFKKRLNSIDLVSKKDMYLKETLGVITPSLLNGVQVIDTFSTLKQWRRYLLRVNTRDYLLANLIHLTLDLKPYISDTKDRELLALTDETKTTYPISITEDLVACVMRQERFVEKMNHFDWLHSPVFLETLDESQIRYHRFFQMITDSKPRTCYVPTLDIDLYWHTHQLSMYNYLKSCKTSCGRLVDHNDKLPEEVLTDGFSETVKQYKKRYKEEYSLCLCWLCVKCRNETRSKIGLFKSRKLPTQEQEAKQLAAKYSLFHTGLAHVSDHNVIKVSLPMTEQLKKNVDKKIRQNGAEYPWAGYYAGSYYLNIYVIAPLYPLPPETECLWDNIATTACGSPGGCAFAGWTNGACSSRHSNCTGPSGGCGITGKGCGTNKCGTCGTSAGATCGGGCGGHGGGGGGGDGSGGGCGGDCGGGCGGCGG